MREVDAAQIVEALNHDGRPVGLPHQAVYFRMTFLAVYHDLRQRSSLAVAIIYFLLETKNHRACGVDHLDFVILGHLISRRRLAVRTEQNFAVFQLGEINMVDGIQSQLLQAFNLKAVMHNIAEAIELVVSAKLTFRAPYGLHNAEAKARTAVDFNFKLFHSP